MYKKIIPVLAFLAVSPHLSAQPKIEHVIVVTGDSVPLPKDHPDGTPEAVFGDRITLFVRDTGNKISDHSKALIYINGKAMPCYKVNTDCAYCKFEMVIRKHDTDSVQKPQSGTAALNKNDTTYVMPPGCFTLTFQLTRDSTEAWDKWYGFGSQGKPFTVDIGNDEKILTCNLKTVIIKTYSNWSIWIAAILAVAFVVFSLRLAFKSGSQLIRDVSTATQKPYSLARFQLFWWSLVVISSYVLLFGLRLHFDLMNPTALILLGISISSTGIATMIDIGDDNKNRHQNAESVGFLKDVISDESGISIHRYQNLIFTFIFGLILIVKVFETGRMPDFGTTELILMGLSSGAYLALKVKENTNAAPAQPKPDQGATGSNLSGQPTAPVAVG